MAEENNNENEELRIGVYICHCGSNIASVVTPSEVVEYASKLPGVAIAKEHRYMCSDPGQNLIQEDIKELGLNRVVVGTCSIAMHEPTFRACISEAGLNPFIFELANIREHASWVHSHEKEAAIEKAKEILFNIRSERISPGLDDKILTSWNALMLRGYVDAFNSFGEKKFLNAAIQNGNFIINNMMKEDGRLNRNYKKGKSSINGFLDDYAYTIEAFIALYEATFNEKWLYTAKELANHTIEHFLDEENGKGQDQ